MLISPIKFIPLIQPGDDLPRIIFEALKKNDLVLENGDILVLAQKIVSKSENRLFNLNDVTPSHEAISLAEKTNKDARLVELILRESKKVIRYRPGTIIVEHKNGFICASAGIDHSNVDGLYGNPEDWVLLLPEDADKSSEGIRRGLKAISGKDIAVLIIDSHGRPWRLGITGISIGMAGMPALVDLRGTEDMFGYKLKITLVAVADELAAAASLVMGQAAERIPAVLVKGFPYSPADGSIKDLIRSEDQDLFR
jgi:coenzyme F420-0:L-glutamate ligase / coenzyme F420-1:gamma-L-glutamate ligase